MTVGLICGFILFVVGLWLIVEPLISSGPVLHRSDVASPPELGSRTVIEELELDYRTGKMSESDYLSLKNKG